MLFARSSFGMVCFSALMWAFSGPGVAYAGHGHFSHGSHGSSGGSFGSHGSSGGSHGSSGGSHGSSGGSHGSSGGSHGSSGGSHGSSGGSHGSSGGSSYSTPATTKAPAPQARYYRRSNNAVARLTVKVPAKSKVYLQDQQMTLNGAVRRFVSPQLNRGTDYVYRVKVEVERDGQLLTKETNATVRAGQQVEVSVQFDEKDESQLVATIAQR